MSTQATIRNIPPGANIGMVYREELPADVKRLEMKYCEQCGISFVRKFAPTTERLAVEFDIGPLGWGHKKCQVMRRRDHGERYCRKCRYAPVPELRVEQLLTEQEQYKIQLPGTPQQMGHATHLPKFSIEARERMSQRAKERWARIRAAKVVQ